MRVGLIRGDSSYNLGRFDKGCKRIEAFIDAAENALSYNLGILLGPEYALFPNRTLNKEEYNNIGYRFAELSKSCPRTLIVPGTSGITLAGKCERVRIYYNVMPAFFGGKKVLEASKREMPLSDHKIILHERLHTMKKRCGPKTAEIDFGGKKVRIGFEICDDYSNGTLFEESHEEPDIHLVSACGLPFLWHGKTPVKKGGYILLSDGFVPLTKAAMLYKNHRIGPFHWNSFKRVEKSESHLVSRYGGFFKKKIHVDIYEIEI